MKNIFLFFGLFIGFSGIAQNSTTNQFSLNFLTPSAEYEFAVGDRTTIDLMAGASIYYRRLFDDTNFGIYPELQAQYRYYYNFEKRLEKAKNTANNSANYIAAIVLYAGHDITHNNFGLSNGSGVIGPAWGLQRVYGKSFKLNLNLGMGYGFNSSDSYLAGIVGLQLGFKLGK